MRTAVAGEGPFKVVASRLRGAGRTTEAVAVIPTAVKATDKGGAISTSWYELMRTFIGRGLTGDVGEWGWVVVFPSFLLGVTTRDEF
jgi:hypothetical protein